MIADNRCRTDGIADEDRHKDKLDIHQHTVGGNTVLPRVFQQLEVVEHADDGCRDVGDQLGGAVCRCGKNRAPFNACPRQMQQTVVWTNKVDKRNDAAYALADTGGNSRTGNTKAEHADKQHIQNHIGTAGRQRRDKTEAWLFGGDKEALKEVLQHERRVEGDDDSAVNDAVLEHCLICAEQNGDGTHEDDADDGNDNTDNQCDPNHHGEIAVCLLGLLFAERFGDKRAATRAKHKADAAEDHDERHNEVDGGERRFADEI